MTAATIASPEQKSQKNMIYNAAHGFYVTLLV